MNKLYPSSLKDAWCVVCTGQDQVDVITWEDGKMPSSPVRYEVRDTMRLAAYCQQNDVYFLDKPSRAILDIDDGGTDADQEWYFTLRIYAASKLQAEIVASEATDYFGGRDAKMVAEIDCDWPKYPDLVRICVFHVKFDKEPDWDKLPFEKFRLPA